MIKIKNNMLSKLKTLIIFILFSVSTLYAEQVTTSSKLPKAFKQISSEIIVYAVIAFVIITLISLIAILVLLMRRTSRERIINSVLTSERIKGLIQNYSPRSLSATTNSIKLSEKEIDIIVDRVLECKRLDFIEQISTQENERNIKVEKTNLRYLKGKQGKSFSRVDENPEDSFFVLYNERGGEAFFEFHGDNGKAIAQRAFSDDICKIISGGYTNANKVKNHKPGRVKNINGKWEVTEVLEVELF